MRCGKCYKKRSRRQSGHENWETQVSDNCYDNISHVPTESPAAESVENSCHDSNRVSQCVEDTTETGNSSKENDVTLPVEAMANSDDDSLKASSDDQTMPRESK